MKAAAKQKDLPELHQTVGSLIRVGKKNATLLSDICSIANIKDKREAYKIIEDLILKYDYTIVGSRKGKYKGYFIPANEKELREALHTVRNEYTSIRKRHNKLIENYKEMSKIAQIQK